MTVEAPEFDPELLGHSAIVLMRDGTPVCHAVVGTFRSDGTPTNATECGLSLHGKFPSAREDVQTPETALCHECWPSEVTGNTECGSGDSG
jgi:hypothetical protein